MFWHTVIEGLKVLTYWQTYVAGLEYIAISLIPMGIAGYVMQKNEKSSTVLGCLSMILLPVLQVIALTVFILTLSPIIFGFAQHAAWSFPWKVLETFPGVFFRLVGILIVAAIVLAFIPFIGRLNSLHTLVLGGIALMFVLSALDVASHGTIKNHVKFIPHFWFFIGLLVIGGVLSWVSTIIAALIATTLDMAEDGIGQLLMIPVGAILGFIPVFMYGAWLGAQLKGGI